jgi:dihydrofolate reductase
MLIYSMSVSVYGFITDREGAFGWSVPSEKQFRSHIAEVRELGGYLCGRRLYETILRWETDRSLRDTELVPRSPTSGARSRRRVQPYAGQRSGQRPARRGVGG